MEELIFYIFSTLVAVATATTSIGLLIPTLMRSDVLKETWLARVERADAVIKRRKIPPELARRIQEYLQYQWLFLRGADESTFFEGLPASLRSERRPGRTGLSQRPGSFGGLWVPAAIWTDEIFDYMHQSCPLLSPSLRIRRMISLIFAWLISLHWGGCIMLWLGLVRSDNAFAGASDFGTGGSWLTWDAMYLRELARDDEIASPDDEMSPFHAYVRSVYWFIVAVSTIGFGDIVPRTIAETWAMGILIAPGAMLYPAIISAIMLLLFDAITARTVLATTVRDFVHRNRLAEPLRSQITLVTELGERFRAESKLLRSLPPSLHVLISAHLYLGMVRAH
ncbi:voltage-gated ion channel superfamily [Chrysochromulina tobinii]|uniref:Voltage-gated ion channel superfamily n=1 Tax=Chrysochromulina tobinii TaxID=1460289 RepID=A0A0M0J618_9EUKA|nr:voltage-gated ion channel superfamily [Chrysochromulina tobinii]|eukprot:KOO22044.1 voltage-gated ion channel superfamily [Chrysochromulina sp. CCMP291]